MKLTKSILASTAILLAATASATAADLYKGGSIKDGYMPVEQARPVSWYVRGDFSHAWQNLGGVTEAPAYNLNGVTLDSARSWGGGVGYYFSPNVRGDITIDWRQNANGTGLIDDGVATVQGTRNFGVKNLVALANVYYDFDTRSRFTPYIGVGLGVSRNTTASGDITVSGCTIVSCVAEFQGATETHVAGALMAGFSARLHSRVSLDAGYRFLYLGDAKTGDVQITRTPPDPTAPDSTPGLRLKDQSAHELRVGLRVDLR